MSTIRKVAFASRVIHVQMFFPNSRHKVIFCYLNMSPPLKGSQQKFHSKSNLLGLE